MAAATVPLVTLCSVLLVLLTAAGASADAGVCGVQTFGGEKYDLSPLGKPYVPGLLYSRVCRAFGSYRRLAPKDHRGCPEHQLGRERG